MCDLEKQTSQMRKPRPTRGLSRQDKKNSSPYIDIILTLFVALVLYIGVAFYDNMKILSFSHHSHFFMVLTLTIFTVFVAALF
jgi:hypothetical protein